MKYEKAMAEVVEFDNSDVVTASAPQNCGSSAVSVYNQCTETAVDVYVSSGLQDLFDFFDCLRNGAFSNSTTTYNDTTTPW